jgi:hypothetical protein
LASPENCRIYSAVLPAKADETVAGEKRMTVVSAIVIAGRRLDRGLSPATMFGSIEGC